MKQCNNKLIPAIIPLKEQIGIKCWYCEALSIPDAEAIAVFLLLKLALLQRLLFLPIYGRFATQDLSLSKLSAVSHSLLLKFATIIVLSYFR